jgi:hypothetical protein
MNRTFKQTKAWLVGHRPTLLKGGLWFASMLLAIFCTAVVTTRFEWHNDIALMVRQDQSARLSAFRDSGRNIFVALSGLNEALVDETDSRAARSRMREAIAQHAAVVMESQDLFGSEEVQAYQRELAKLREATDRAVQAENSMAMQQIALDLLAKRNAMIAHGRRTIID